MVRLLFFVLGVALLIVSCGKKKMLDENQEKIYSNYELFYDQNEDRTHAVARFRFGGETGSLLELEDSSIASVLFNGDKLPYDVWFGGHHKEYPGHISEGVFVYTNTNNTVYKNTVPTGNTASFPSDFDTIKKGAYQTLLWGGDMLTDNEHVGLFIETWTWGEFAEFYANEVGDSNIILTATQTEFLSTSTSTKLFMDRTISVPITQGTNVGGKISYKYRCLNKEVVVIE